MQLKVCDISQIAPRVRAWEISPMSKPDVPPGVSASLIDILQRAKPSELSVRKWCEQARVSPSFFTDLKNGREPGIDKVERLAAVVGLTLSELVAGQQPPTRIVPDESELEAMLSEIVSDEVTMQTRLADLPRIFGTALHVQLEHYRSGLGTRPAVSEESARGASARPRQPTTRSAAAESRKT